MVSAQCISYLIVFSSNKSDCVWSFIYIKLSISFTIFLSIDTPTSDGRLLARGRYAHLLLDLSRSCVGFRSAYRITSVDRVHQLIHPWNGQSCDRTDHGCSSRPWRGRENVISYPIWMIMKSLLLESSGPIRLYHITEPLFLTRMFKSRSRVSWRLDVQILSYSITLAPQQSDITAHDCLVCPLLYSNFPINGCLFFSV